MTKWKEIHSLFVSSFSLFPSLSIHFQLSHFVANVLLSFNCIFRRSSVAVILLITVIV